MTPYQLLRDKLHRGKDMYEGYPQGWSGVWYDDPGARSEIFKVAIERAKPGIIFEVGSFVGESAIFMADYLKSRRMNAAILAIDTWYFGYDHHLGAPEKIRMHFGRPDLFYRFMANVIERGASDAIIPFAMDSTNAARVLKWMGIMADMVYVDASHEQGDVIRDLESYWPLLKKGGVMLCDDYSSHFNGVVADIDAFAKAHQLPMQRYGAKVMFVKP